MKQYFLYKPMWEDFVYECGTVLREDDVVNIEVSEAVYRDFQANPRLYIYRDEQAVKLAPTEYLAYQNEKVALERSMRYAAEVDHLTAEYTRKRYGRDFNRGEAKKLQAEIDARVQQIKADLPYWASENETP